jgi:hypothetical protein
MRGMVLRRSWANTSAASAARSDMITMSVDFIVMGDCSCRKSPNHVFNAPLDERDADAAVSRGPRLS